MKLLQVVRLVVLFYIFMNAKQSYAEAAYDSVADVQLTQAEKNWLKRHKSVRVAFDGDLHPYSFIGRKGTLRGSAVEIMNLLGQRLGIKFVTYPNTHWKALFKASVIGNVDVIATMVKRPERLLWFNFTEPYLTQSLIIVSRGDDERFNDRDSIKGQKIALIANYQYSFQVQEDYPGIKPVFVSSLKEGLTAIQKGKADAGVLLSGARYFLLSDTNFSDLKISSIYDHESVRQSIAVRKDWPELVAILQKGLDSLSANEKQQLIDKWDPPEEDESAAGREPVKVAGPEVQLVVPDTSGSGLGIVVKVTLFAALALMSRGWFLRLRPKAPKKSRYKVKPVVSEGQDQKKVDSLSTSSERKHG